CTRYHVAFSRAGRTQQAPRPRSSGLAASLHAVPPRADAGHEIVIAGDHLNRLALPVLGGFDAQPARLLLLFLRHPTALVAPQTRTELAFKRLPDAVVNQLAAPAVLDQKPRRIPGVEGSHVIAGVTTECDRDALGIAKGKIVALAHIIEAVELDHHVVDHVDAALNKGDAVMARIDMEEIPREWPQPIITELEFEDISVERHHLRDAFKMHHNVTHAERTGAESGYVAPGLERISRRSRTVENLQPIAAGIAEHDQVRNVPLAGERSRAAGDLSPSRFNPRRYLVESGGVSDLPAEERDTLAAVGADDQTLLAVGHTKGQARATFVDALQPEQPFAVARPVVDILGANPDIAQRFDAHDDPRALALEHATVCLPKIGAYRLNRQPSWDGHIGLIICCPLLPSLTTPAS